VTGTTSSSVSLAWSASTDASGRVTYRVYVNGGWQGNAAEPSHSQGGLRSDTSYTFVVRAVDRYGNVSRSSNSVTATTAAGGGGVPGTPVNLRVTGVDYDSIDLAWDAPPGASVAYYLIYRNGLWVNSSYGLTGSADYLTAGTTHTIEVRARGTDNSLSAPAAVTATTRADAGPPTAPANLRVETDAFGRPSGLTWDASTDDRGVSNYWLFADGSDAFGGGLGVSFYSLTDEYCTVFSGQTYTFTVRARDLSGNLSSTGTPLTVTVP
jgi:chitodextrinase